MIVEGKIFASRLNFSIFENRLPKNTSRLSYLHVPSQITQQNWCQPATTGRTKIHVCMHALWTVFLNDNPSCASET